MGRTVVASGNAAPAEDVRPVSPFNHVAHGTPAALSEYIAECVALDGDCYSAIKTGRRDR
jgi:hypothetical protein